MASQPWEGQMPTPAKMIIRAEPKVMNVGRRDYCKMKLDLVFPALPPQLDGIGDYTARLALELSKSAQVKVLTGEGPGPTQIPGVSIDQIFSAANRRSIRYLISAIETDTPDWLLLQYNPNSYGRWGLNLDLPLVIRDIKRRRPHVRIAVMMHETFVPISNWKFAIMTTWQRWQLWMLGRSADVVFLSIEPWVRKFQVWWPNKPVLHLPVGSNIPCLPMSRSDARQRTGIREDAMVVGVFGTAHPSRMLDRVCGAVKEVLRQSTDVLVLYIGPDGQEVRAALRDIPFSDVGVLTPGEISRHFAAMDVYLAPFTDGVSTRRGSFMVALHHGIPTVSTAGDLTDEVLLTEQDRAFFLAPVTAAEEFNAKVVRLIRDTELRSRMGAEGRRLYERAFAWDIIADQLLSHLRSRSDGYAVGSSLESDEPPR